MSGFTNIPVIVSGKFSHTVKKGVLLGYPGAFYQKEMASHTEAFTEQLAQEFFRLIIPLQPETLCGVNKNTNTFFILSSEIKGFRLLPLLKKDNVQSAAHKGLGQIMLTAIFVHEVDLKNGNIGLDKHNRVVKIDGDWCFAAIRSRQFALSNRDITPKLLECLPHQGSYRAFNWLDTCVEGAIKSPSSLFDKSLINSEVFHNEVNEAVFKILLVPEEYLSRFVDVYVPYSHKAYEFICFLAKRRGELNAAALKSASFKKYVLSVAALDLMQEHVAHLCAFKAHRHNAIIDESEYKKTNQQINELYEALLYELAMNFDEYRLNQALVQLKKINVTIVPGDKSIVQTYFNTVSAEVDACMQLASRNSCTQYIAYQPVMQLAMSKKADIELLRTEYKKRCIVLQQMGFDEQMGVLNEKRIELAKKSLLKPQYELAHKAFATVYDNLLKARKQFLFSHPHSLQQARKEFKMACLDAVSQAKGILVHHREWQGWLAQFIVNLFNKVTFGMFSTAFSLFAQTDSIKKVEKLTYLVSNNLKIS